MKYNLLITFQLLLSQLTFATFSTQPLTTQRTDNLVTWSIDDESGVSNYRIEQWGNDAWSLSVQVPASGQPTYTADITTAPVRVVAIGATENSLSSPNYDYSEEQVSETQTFFSDLLSVNVVNPSAQEITAIRLDFSETSSLNDLQKCTIIWQSADQQTEIKIGETSLTNLTLEESKSVEIPLSESGSAFTRSGKLIIVAYLNPDAVAGNKVDVSCRGLNYEGMWIETTQSNSENLTVGSGKRRVFELRMGDNGINTYRIPGVITTKAGTLLAVYDLRHTLWADLPRDIDVGGSRSTDGGRTWQNIGVIADMGDEDEPEAIDNGCGDPCILQDKNTGRIFVLALWSHGNNGTPNAGKRQHADGQSKGSDRGLDKKVTGQTVLVYSDDDGVTWSEPRNITSEVKDPEWFYMINGPGAGVTMADGTLVFPVNYLTTDRKNHATVMFSRDNGETWQIKKNTLPAAGSENQVTELGDGRLMMNVRGGNYRKIYTSNNLGETWETHQLTIDQSLSTPACQGDVFQFADKRLGDSENITLISHPWQTTARLDLNIAFSQDHFDNWGRKIVQPDGVSYSCMTRVNDSLAVIYEAEIPGFSDPSGNRPSSYEAEALVIELMGMNWLSDGAFSTPVQLSRPNVSQVLKDYKASNGDNLIFAVEDFEITQAGDLAVVVEHANGYEKISENRIKINQDQQTDVTVFLHILNQTTGVIGETFRVNVEIKPISFPPVVKQQIADLTIAPMGQLSINLDNYFRSVDGAVNRYSVSTSTPSAFTALKIDDNLLKLTNSGSRNMGQVSITASSLAGQVTQTITVNVAEQGAKAIVGFSASDGYPENNQFFPLDQEFTDNNGHGWYCSGGLVQMLSGRLGMNADPVSTESTNNLFKTTAIFKPDSSSIAGAGMLSLRAKAWGVSSVYTHLGISSSTDKGKNWQFKGIYRIGAGMPELPNVFCPINSSEPVWIKFSIQSLEAGALGILLEDVTLTGISDSMALTSQYLEDDHATIPVEREGHIKYDFGPQSSFTIETWFCLHRDGAAGNQYIISNGMSSASKHKGWLLTYHQSSGKILVNLSKKGTSQAIYSDNPVEFGTWYHAAFTVNRATDEAKFYVNGAQQGSTLSIPGYDLDEGEDLAIRDIGIGFNIAGGKTSAKSDCSLSELRIWNRARTADELFQTMNCRLTENMLGLSGVWPLNGTGVDLIAQNSVEFSINSSRFTPAAVPILADEKVNNGFTVLGEQVGSVTIDSDAVVKPVVANYSALQGLAPSLAPLPETVGSQFATTWQLVDYHNANSSTDWQVDLTSIANDPALIPADLTTVVLLYKKEQKADNFTIVGSALANSTPNAISFEAIPSQTGFYSLGVVGEDRSRYNLQFDEENGVLSWQFDSVEGLVGYVIEVLDQSGHWQIYVAGELSDDLSYSVTVERGGDYRLRLMDANGFETSSYPDKGAQSTVTVDVNEGWNLLALPLTDISVREVQDHSNYSCWQWNSELSNYELLAEVKPQMGFWFYLEDSEVSQLQFSGSISGQNPIELAHGWNLHGVESETVVQVDSLIYQWSDGIYRKLDENEVMTSGYGYWSFKAGQ